MTGRERIASAIQHKETDRSPIDMGSNPSSGISATAYHNLVASLGNPDAPVRVYDVVQELAEPEEWVLDHFGIDVIDIGRTFTKDDGYWQPILLNDSIDALYPSTFTPERCADGSFVASKNGEILARKPSGATFYDQTVFPFQDGYPDSYADLPEHMGRVLWSAFVHAPWDSASGDGFWDRLRRETIALREQTDKALMVVVGCNLFEWGTFLRRIDNFLMDIYTEPEAVEGLLDQLVEIHLGTLENVCEAVGDIVDVVRFGDDLGMDSGPFMSADHYRSLFMPRHRMLTDYVKKHSSMTPFLHSCGSIYELIPSLIEAGFEVLNPVQTNCVNMEPERLKSEFGADLTFWGGGIDTRTTLNTGSPAVVKDEVRHRLDILLPGGGYVFNTVHNILPDVPPENIIAMFEAIHEYGG